MEYIEITGKTVDEAITNATIKLSVTSDKLEYEVVDKGSKGFLGINSRPAVIKVRIAQKEDRKSTRLNSSHTRPSRMPSSA